MAIIRTTTESSEAVDECLERAAAAPASALFRALGDQSRLVILSHLQLGEHRVTDLTAHLGLAQSTVSKHLRCLQECGLVQSRPEGRASIFSLTYPDQIASVIQTAQLLLTQTGDATEHCDISSGDSKADRQESAASAAPELLSASGDQDLL